MNHNSQLSIVIPVKEEEENLPLLLQEIDDVVKRHQIPMSEVILIDDGSQDKTWTVIQSLCDQYAYVLGLKLQYNCGKAAALSLGFSRARGEFVITMDGDLQDNPNEIPALLDLLHNGYDLVSGWKVKRHDPWHKTMPSKLFNLVTSWFAGIRLHDFNCGLKAYRRVVIENVKLYGDFHRYIPVMAKWRGFKVTEMGVEHRARIHGVSKYGLSRLVSGFLDLLTLVFLQKYAVRPLHFFGTIGLLFALLGSGIMGYFAIYWIIHHSLHVRPLMVLGGFSLIMGIQFISLGLLGEMITGNRNHNEHPIADEKKGNAL